MKTPEPEMFVLHIRDAILRIEEFTKGKHRSDIEMDEMLSSAVGYQIIIIGEASSHLSVDVKNEMPDISWKDVIGTRHKVVHDYFGVDLKVVWDIVENKLSILKSAISNYISNHPEIQKMDEEAEED